MGQSKFQESKQLRRIYTIPAKSKISDFEKMQKNCFWIEYKLK